jgi:hypothetical protein
MSLYLQGRLDEAEDLLRKGAETMEKTHGKDFIYTVHMQYVLARVLVDKKSYREAEELGRHTLASRRRIFRAGHEFIGRSLALLGRILAEQDKTDKTAEAESLLNEASTLFRERCPDKKDLIADADHWLGACLLAGQQYEEAERLLVPSYQVLKLDPGVPARHKAMALRHVVQLYEAWGKKDKAAQYSELESKAQK